MAKLLPRAPSSGRSYTDFEPDSKWLEGEESDILLVDLSDFNKEQLKVTISTSGVLKISGERPIEGNHWVRFLKYFTVPKRSNPRGIQAKFDKEEGLLYVVLPKIASQWNNSRNHTQTQGPLSGSNATANERNGAPKLPEHRHPATTSDEIASGGGAENSRRGGTGTVMGFSKRKILLVNAAVIFMVLVGIGVYLVYKLRLHRGKESSLALLLHSVT